jgi:hypothetical protein
MKRRCGFWKVPVAVAAVERRKKKERQKREAVAEREARGE